MSPSSSSGLTRGRLKGLMEYPPDCLTIQTTMKETERILRVDHAGEMGAIHIYKAQLFVSKWFYKDLIDPLKHMLDHERAHFKTFDSLMKKRGIRACYGLYLWALGGLILGLFTALMGRNAIWVCTDSIESTVLHHLEWQLDVLKAHDTEAYQAVRSIQADEEDHQQWGAQQGQKTWFSQSIFWVVRKSTEFAIWLSTKL